MCGHFEALAIRVLRYQVHLKAVTYITSEETRL